MFVYLYCWRLHLCLQCDVHNHCMLFCCTCVVVMWACVCLLTRDGVGEAVRMFGNECILDVPPTNSMCTWMKGDNRLVNPVTDNSKLWLSCLRCLQYFCSCLWFAQLLHWTGHITPVSVQGWSLGTDVNSLFSHLSLAFSDSQSPLCLVFTDCWSFHCSFSLFGVFCFFRM